MTGARITVKCLLEQGVRDIFGYPGASVLSLFEAINGEKRLNLFVNTNEQFCAFAADGYARASGRVGVCIATSGPGATNLVTGIANAYMDSIPLVAITGNVPLRLLGTDAFQEVDIAGVTMPVTKHNFIVKSVDKLAETLRLAFKIACEGRKGPVLVDVPSNIFDETCPFRQAPAAVPGEKILPANIQSVAGLINNSINPAVCVGGGVISSGAGEEVRKLVSLLDCPVVSTAMGIGAFDSTDIRYRGLVGMNISDDASEVIDSADLLIAVGVRFSDRMICSFRKRTDLKIVHIDIDSAEIDKNTQPFDSLVGDAAYILKALKPYIEQRAAKRVYAPQNPAGLPFSLINVHFPDAVYTTEVGLHQVEACRNIAIRAPRRFLTSGGLGSMGYGLPAAIGASIANNGSKTVNIAGDGSFNMNMQEIATAARYGIPVIEFVINNSSLGMIGNMLPDINKPQYCDVAAVDYSLLAPALGASYFLASDAASLDSALRKAKECKTPVIIEYRKG